MTTSLGPARLWATVGHGVINEVYWPSTGEPQLRDLTFYLVGEGRWIDLKRVRQYDLQVPAPHEPLLTVTHTGADYHLTLEVLPDPRRDVLLIRFTLSGPYRLVTIAAPHLSGTGHDNYAWVDGELFAQRHRHVLCLGADVALLTPGVGYVGQSDGWQDLVAHGALTYAYTAAGPGSVALSAELAAPHGVIALGFAESAVGARGLVRASLAEGYDAARATFARDWERWGAGLDLPAPTQALGALARLSATVLRIHEDRTYPGALVASLSTPWGNSTDTLGGYHLVWPRDATLSAFALIAAHQLDDARRILARFLATQEPDGHWAQNTYPSGAAFWTGLQLDETAFPVLLAAKLREAGAPELGGTRSMVRRALAFVARSGPTSDQDRWEENPGVNPFTLAVCVAALIAGADWLDDQERAYALSLADEWNERLEQWCYVTGTPLALEQGVTGYYVRLAPPELDGGLTGQVQLRNRQGERVAASALVSLDFSYLTRLGLRGAGDTRVQDTIRVVDALLRVSTPSGELYHRYNGDGYGEHEDGSPFDGSGVGRAWPLLVGERGHLALQAGEDPLPYLETMRRCASSGGLLPEQVWDAAAVAERGLEPGRPSGSAMPLLWAHAEFLKLLVARHSGRPAELLRVVEAHVAAAQGAAEWRWRNETPVSQLLAGRALLIESPRPFTLHFGWDGWQDVQERPATLTPFGLWSVCFEVAELRPHGTLNFTRRFPETWEGRDHDVALHHRAGQHLQHQEP
ncbi:glycoside hydrolase family 15 protein [Deinococcus sp. AB2017081]|uniref:glycoside hydrolase family 15 protein n=1 Tax=Deinococcus sp. AB2017081 TaxID=3093660 RepID=UPI002ACC005B|nr:glycoside hydrolase family 15 protein [Deinococcus sp. AB2017081]WQE97211.1 glycoside hydrolase family 15 protein [Deinococcus sp. AB2017081]